MVKFQTIRQKARIILHSEDAMKTTNMNNIIPIRAEPIRFDGSTGTNVDIATVGNADRLHIFNHRLNNNDAVVYTNTGGTVVAPLVNNTTYYVIFVSDNIIQLSATTAGGNPGAPIDFTSVGTGTHTLTRTTLFNGSSDTVVSNTENSITIANHRLLSGDLIQYNTTGTAIAGLTNNRYYYVIKVDDNIFKLANSFQEATGLDITPIDLTAVGVGATHNIREIVSFDSSGSPTVDLVNERINIPAHNLNTGDMVLYQCDTQGYVAGTTIGGLVDNLYYYVIATDPDSIRLAHTKAQATSAIPVPINIVSVGTGSNHSFTRIVLEPIPVCTNYRFKLNSLPFDMNDKCRLAVQYFDYVRNYKTTNCKAVGSVYLKSIMPSNTYTSQSSSYGTLALPINFIDSFSYQNNDIENNSMPLPGNIDQILQNNFDVFIDSKKRNFSNQSINGFIDEDAWSMSLIIYEMDELEVITHELDTKVKNSINPRLV